MITIFVCFFIGVVVGAIRSCRFALQHGGEVYEGKIKGMTDTFDIFLSKFIPPVIIGCAIGCAIAYFFP